MLTTATRPAACAAGVCAVLDAATHAARGGEPAAVTSVAVLSFAMLLPAALVVIAGGTRLWPRVKRRWIAVALAGAAAVLAHYANSVVLVRLYPWAHLLGAVATVVFASVACAIGLASLRCTRLASLLLVGAWIGALVSSGSRLSSSHQLRASAVEGTAITAPLLRALSGALPEIRPRTSGARGGTLAQSAMPAPVRGASGAARGANVLWITIDSLRADRLGSEPPLMPRLEALASSSLYYDNAYAPSCATIPSMSASLASRPPSAITYREVAVTPALEFLPSRGLTLRKNQATPVPELAGTTVAALLRRAGYSTTTVPSYVFYLKAAGVTVDFSEVVEEPFRARAVDGMGIIDMDIGAEVSVFDRGPRAPWMVWLHFMEPHAPYRAHGLGTASASERYDAELRATDARLGAILDRLEASGQLERTVIVVHADHGEELGDHGGSFHASELYQETIHVPLVIKLPGQLGAAARARVSESVSVLDVVPTLVDVLGLPTAESFVGRSLWPEPPTDRVIASQCRVFGHDKVALVHGHHKLIVDRGARTLRLFDLEHDPGERDNLADSAPELRDTLLDVYEALVPIWGW